MVTLLPDIAASDQVWLTVIGIGEDGLEGLSAVARAHLDACEIVAGGRRHLDLVASLGKAEHEWGVPFTASIPPLLALRGRRVVVLASGDPFWYGVGAVLAAHVDASEMRTLPNVSTFGWAAARLGWRIEDCVTLGLHARPLALMRPHLRNGERLIVLLRDAAAVSEAMQLLTGDGFGGSRVTILEALGGPRERVRLLLASEPAPGDIAAPVAIAIEPVAGPDARIIPCRAGLPDAYFENDGQLTKREIRALTLSSLAPRGNETLWDIGAGAGSIGIEWLLAHSGNRAVAVESRVERLERAGRNALALGVPHLTLHHGFAPDALAGLPAPDAIFIGGGVSRPGVLDAAWAALGEGGRLVVNAVTLESEALLIAWHVRHGGALTRIAISRADPVGDLRGWRSAMPVTQWSAVK
jgi:precorrin-6B C5,15-methyltransferase / cobalt-precorrin-6B C5,C15-methyltransferase